MNKVNLPMDTPHHYHMRKHQRNLLTLSPPLKSTQVFHHHPFLRTHQWNLFWILLLIPVFLSSLFPVLINQIYSSLLIHIYYPALHLQDLISWHILSQTISFPPQHCHQNHLKKNYPKTTDLILPHPQVWVHPQIQLYSSEPYIIYFQMTL